MFYYSMTRFYFLILNGFLFLIKKLVTVGTQAAVLAGLDITMFIEFNPDKNDAWVSTTA